MNSTFIDKVAVNPNGVLDVGSGSTKDLDRREALLNIGKTGLGVLFAALPFAGTGCAGIGKLVANDPKRAADVLNFALLLERREAEFYKIGLQTPGLVPASDRLVLNR